MAFQAGMNTFSSACSIFFHLLSHISPIFLLLLLKTRKEEAALQQHFNGISMYVVIVVVSLFIYFLVAYLTSTPLVLRLFAQLVEITTVGMTDMQLPFVSACSVFFAYS
jgi:cobalamin biosynthesis protein CobD/CbiB